MLVWTVIVDDDEIDENDENEQLLKMVK